MTQETKVDFGFGCMRLPVLEADQPDSFDYEKIESLFDAFLEKGFTYFDTAYTYHGYHGGGGSAEDTGGASSQGQLPAGDKDAFAGF